MLKACTYILGFTLLFAGIGYKVSKSPVGTATRGYENTYIWGAEAAKAAIEARERRTNVSDIPNGSTLNNLLGGSNAHAATISKSNDYPNPNEGYSINTHPSHYRQ